nr:hypothetical protein [Nitrosomonas sp.]
MIGGLGNDTFVVNNVGDVSTEFLNEGTDKVNSNITYTSFSYYLVKYRDPQVDYADTISTGDFNGDG